MLFYTKHAAETTGAMLRSKGSAPVGALNLDQPSSLRTRAEQLCGVLPPRQIHSKLCKRNEREGEAQSNKFLINFPSL